MRIRDTYRRRTGLKCSTEWHIRKRCRIDQLFQRSPRRALLQRMSGVSILRKSERLQTGCRHGPCRNSLLFSLPSRLPTRLLSMRPQNTLKQNHRRRYTFNRCPQAPRVYTPVAGLQRTFTMAPFTTKRGYYLLGVVTMPRPRGRHAFNRFRFRMPTIPGQSLYYEQSRDDRYIQESLTCSLWPPNNTANASRGGNASVCRSDNS